VASDLVAFRAVLCPEGSESVDGDGPGTEAGVLFPTGDAAALATALGALLDDPGRRRALTAAGRARVAAFDWPVVASAVLRVYRAAVAADPRRIPGRASAGAR
jgi:phosphatidylinositol alpha-mannosyltransferase